MQKIVQYPFTTGVNVILEIPTDTARRFLPKGIEPIESNHGVSLIGFTMFDFSESPVGPYQELVVSLYAVPRLGIMEQHPHAAVYPIVVASSSQEARDHAIDLWHLPHFMEDIAIEFAASPDGRTMTGSVRCHKGQPILEITIRHTSVWKPVYQLYQSFQSDNSGNYIGIMDMQGMLCEHDENTGTLRLYDHRFFNPIDLSGMDTIPFREMWMTEGVETYHELITIGKPVEQAFSA